ncbi:MAG: ABC transporter ATP-binding protein, partial [Elusimicrobiota bacterium]
MNAILDVRNLTVQYRRQKKQPWVSALRSLDLVIEKGESLGIVGESGCGKSTLALTLMGLLPPMESQIKSGQILFSGKDLIHNSPYEWRSLRSKKIAMIFQDPFSALNPVLTIGYQLKEVLPDEKELLLLLEKVQLKDPNRILSSYPHQLSGGQRQRVMIAMAIAQKPELLIADEPTTALDVSVQSDIVKLLKNLKEELKMSLLFVSHNIGLVKTISEKMA